MAELQSQGRKHAVIKTGWLHKKGAVRRNWKKRWFELTESHLRYFTAPHDNKGEEKGLIVLQARPPPRPISTSSHEFAFEIPGISASSKVVRDSNHASMFRTFSLYADTKEDMAEWMDKVGPHTQQFYQYIELLILRPPLPSPPCRYQYGVETQLRARH